MPEGTREMRVADDKYINILVGMRVVAIYLARTAMASRV
jgi:hypothetical protein